ncbi:hypothetical protein UY3_07059 [Chelonia mydas]|uniref:Uncharacterized protein n=1 Tax=Chelonia mydas TaxID=8469 RepID=M7C5Q0_CHEMY|nr:hypothetical protein UY3_07059 [Chelonia mydas]
MPSTDANRPDSAYGSTYTTGMALAGSFPGMRSIPVVQSVLDEDGKERETFLISVDNTDIIPPHPLPKDKRFPNK